MAPNPEHSADRYVRRLIRLSSRLDRIEIFLDGISKDDDLNEILARKELLETTWSDYNALSFEKEFPVLDDEGTEVVEAIEHRYPLLKAAITRQLSLRTVPNEETREAAPSNIHIKLPKLNITQFAGDEITLWPQFKDIFESAVHNLHQIPAIQKFQILLGLLKGDALGTINDIKITDANYWVAWDKLLGKYDKPKRIIAAHLNEFFNIPSVKEPNPKALSKLCGQSEGILRQLAMLHDDATKRDVWIIHFLLNKVDQNTRDEWAKITVNTNYPTEEDFFKFLKERCDALDNALSIIAKVKPRSTETRNTFSHHSQTSSLNCNGNHNLFKCSQFRDLSVQDRRLLAKEKGLCFNCLSRGHSGVNCKSKYRCHTCQARHHTLLHSSNSNLSSAPIATSSNSNQSSNQAHVSSAHPLTSCLSTDALETQYSSVTDQVNSFNCNSSQVLPTHPQSVKFVLLPTILVNVRDKAGKMQPCRALLDTGSQSCFITENCIQRLGLPRSNARIAITGVAEKDAGISRGKTHLALYSRYNSQSHISIDALILTKLTQMLPSKPIYANFDEFSQLVLADPTFKSPGKIDILIGAAAAFRILKPKQIVTTKSGLIAHDTIFGWVISGGVDEKIQSTTTLTTQVSLENIDSTLRRFWEINEIQSNESFWSEEEKLCESHFVATHKREQNGRYVVELPFKSEKLPLGNSLFQACKRQTYIEKRLSMNRDLQFEYNNFLDEYENLFHMHRIPSNEVHIEPEISFYLPHHPVIKADSSTTKVRVVFDASAKTTSGNSLNDMLMIGPTVQSSLIAIILRFRRHRIAFSADVEKMYRQIQIAPHHQDFQRIVWRKSPEAKLQHYRLTTVTYGMASAPYLATRVLHELAEVNKPQLGLAAETVQHDFYVDDLMSGADTLENAIELQQNIVTILSSGGFSLRKWASNNNTLLSSICDAEQLKEAVVALDDDDKMVKVLGLQWSPSNDTFNFKVNVNDKSVSTKRTLLSEAAKLFDPLGWLAPVIIKIKILFQKLWIIKLDWDEQLPNNTIDEWTKIKSELKTLEKIHIPRWLKCSSNRKENVQIHGFCDASQDAYAACLYCRVIDDDNGTVNVHLIVSKTKVAPIKQISIPRLELCAAQLLKNLYESTVSVLEMESCQTYFWSDSTIVLSWLSAIPRTLKTFVANRVSDIQMMKHGVIWKHISSIDNPADCASRGLHPSNLANYSL